MRTELLVAGHYCHDTIRGKESVRSVLGGSAAYSSAVLQAAQARFAVASKVGGDFLYHSQVPAKPQIIESARTTSFIDDYTAGERVSICDAVCEPIWPRDLPGPCEVALACPIAGEVPPETIRALRGLSRLLLADVQGLIRSIGPRGQVTHLRLEDTPFAAVVGALDYLKTSAEEARALDLPALCRQTRVIVTEGSAGCTLYTSSAAPLHLPAFAAEERDSTGAGDCFLAGFALGLLRGLPVERALRLGNFCGAQAVSTVGIPRIDPALLAAQIR